jgi:2-methylcitrate dehydratase PrpD
MVSRRMTAIRLTEQLGAFVSVLDASSTPEEARRRAIGGFIDCIGVMTAGAKETVTTVVRKTAASGGGTARPWPDGARASATDAALINGAAAHALDYDDTGLKGHPSAYSCRPFWPSPRKPVPRAPR